MKKLSVNLVVKNGAQYAPFIASSLKKQTFNDFEVIMIDNFSDDNTIQSFKTAFEREGIGHRIIENKENLGFAVGHNQAFNLVNSPYFLLLNADTYLMPDVLEKAVNFLENHPETAAVSPRLMRWNFELTLASMKDVDDVAGAARNGFTSQIDAIGIRLFKNRRAVEWLTRQEWVKDSSSIDVQKIFSKTTLEVFGVSGAFAIYRKNVIEKILLPGNNIFDPTYHSYKEDLDLAYRLRNAGYVSYVLLDTAVYHDRTGAGPKKMSDFAALANKRRQSFFIRHNSYKNHLRTLYKNEYWQNFLMDFPFIFWYEFKKFFFLLFTNPKVIFYGWRDLIKERKYTRQARKAILKTRKMYWKGLRRWWL